MDPANTLFADANAAKVSFDNVYDLPDPRHYYRTLGALDYRIPTEARQVFHAVLDTIDSDAPSVVDVGCSYGVNAAMIKYDLEFSDLVARYRSPSMRSASVAESIRSDAGFFAELKPACEARFTGVDVAAEAVGYARAVGLLDAAISDNLELSGLSPGDAAAVAGADLIITTGAVGYVTDKTFKKLVAAADGNPPCIAAFVLRQFPFDAIAESLKRFGLETEKTEGRYFQQRRFSDEIEMAGALAGVEALGLDPAGLEADGHYYAEFFYAAPSSAPRLSDMRI